MRRATPTARQDYIGQYLNADGKCTLPDSSPRRGAAAKAGTAEDQAQGSGQPVEPSKSRVTFGACRSPSGSRRSVRSGRASVPSSSAGDSCGGSFSSTVGAHPLDALARLDVETWADGVRRTRHGHGAACAVVAVDDPHRGGRRPAPGAYGESDRRRSWEPSDAADKDEPEEGRGSGQAVGGTCTGPRHLGRLDSEAARLMVLIAQWTGMRYGEICAIRRTSTRPVGTALRGQAERRTFRVWSSTLSWASGARGRPSSGRRDREAVLSSTAEEREERAGCVPAEGDFSSTASGNTRRRPHPYLFTTPRERGGAAATGTASWGGRRRWRRGALPEGRSSRPWLRIAQDLWERIEDSDPGARRRAADGDRSGAGSTGWRGAPMRCASTTSSPRPASCPRSAAAGRGWLTCARAVRQSAGTLGRLRRGCRSCRTGSCTARHPLAQEVDHGRGRRSREGAP